MPNSEFEEGRSRAAGDGVRGPETHGMLTKLGVKSERGNVWRDERWMTSVPGVSPRDMQRGQCSSCGHVRSRSCARGGQYLTGRSARRSLS